MTNLDELMSPRAVRCSSISLHSPAAILANLKRPLSLSGVSIKQNLRPLVKNRRFFTLCVCLCRERGGGQQRKGIETKALKDENQIRHHRFFFVNRLCFGVCVCVCVFGTHSRPFFSHRVPSGVCGRWPLFFFMGNISD